MKADDTLRIIAYLEGDLSSSEKEAFEKEMEGDPKLREELDRLRKLYMTMETDPEVQAPEIVREDFNRLLEDEKNRQKNKNLWITWGGRIAAGIALVALGVWLGLGLNNDADLQEDQMAQLKSEIEANRQLILGAMNESSASRRFVAVNASENLKKPDPEIIDALVKVMNTDENTNVRVAAVRALSRFAHEEAVKDKLIDALLTQSDPLVQVELIEILVELGEKEVVPTLERLIQEDTILEEVKNEAYWGVMKLS